MKFHINDSLVDDIMEGLDATYQPFIHAIKARNASISYNDLYALLLSEEAQLKLDNWHLDSSISHQHNMPFACLKAE